MEYIEYVSMLWGLQIVDAWPLAVASMVDGRSRHALSFDEPDRDPQTAATTHIKYMNPLAGKLFIGSPTITNGAGTDPLMASDRLTELFRA
ncbi:hypothetical protein LTR46_012032, partial [Exophiala xenobiotica]